MNPITMQLVADKYIKMALEEDINSEDVSTNAVMPEYKKGDVQLICKEDGIIAGLQIFERVFTLLDEKTQVEFFVKDGEKVKKGQTLAVVTGDIRVLLSGERTALNYLRSFWRDLRRSFWIPAKQRRVCVFLKNMRCASAADAITDIICRTACS